MGRTGKSAGIAARQEVMKTTSRTDLKAGAEKEIAS